VMHIERRVGRFFPTSRAARVSARTLLTFAVACMAVAPTAYCQTDPWSNIAGKLGGIFSGPIAKGFALVAVVVGGLELAFGEGSSKRTVAGIVMGLGLALGAASFLGLFTP